ncbi:MAG: GNAT family protein [Betaproteobacteria bacterium]
MDITPLTLTGRHLRLEPLSLDHVSDLEYACKDSPDGRRSIWRYLLDARVYRERGMSGLVQVLLDRQAAGTDLPFAMVDLKTGNAVGTTRYMEIEIENRVVEVGTWIGLNFQREGLNLESKQLMLKHAFNTLGVMRVQFKIDHRNFASLDAIERLRAYKEGVLRNHIILADGTPRSSVYYSILDSEWPAIDLHLENLMARATS